MRHISPHATSEQHAFGNARYEQALGGAALPLKIGMQMTHKPDPQTPGVFVAAFVYHDGTAQSFDGNVWRTFPNRDAFMAVYTGFAVSKCHYFDRAGHRVKSFN